MILKRGTRTLGPRKGPGLLWPALDRGTSAVVCGVFGQVDPGGSSLGALRRMGVAQQHRGPDGMGVSLFGEGTVGLGMNLLSLVGSDVEPGPYVSSGGVGLVFNGEIYNFRELARAWGVTISHRTSDAHVLLAGWTRHGPAVLDMLDGMFALVVWDDRTSTVYLARDRLGEKPLYLHSEAGVHTFASEVKAIRSAAALTPSAPHGWHATESMVGEMSPYAGLRLLEPASLVTIDTRSGHVSSRTWWNLEAIEPGETCGRAAQQEFDRRLDHAIDSRRFAGDSALLLSGGVDSAILAHRLRPSLLVTARTAGDSRYDEYDNAQRIARDTGIPLICVEPTPADFKSRLGDLVRAIDYPMGNASLLAEDMLLDRVAAEGIRVVYGGVGPDEALLGYVRQLIPIGAMRMVDPETRGAYAAMEARYHEAIAAGSSFPHAYARAISRSHTHEGHLSGLVDAARQSEDDIARALTRIELDLNLGNLLLVSDKLAASYGLERRSPYLESQWFQFAFSLPLEHKMGEGFTKLMLRRYAERENVASDIWQGRGKRGFASPIPTWLNTELRQWASDLMAGASATSASPPAPLTDSYSRSFMFELMISVWMDSHRRDARAHA